MTRRFETSPIDVDEVLELCDLARRAPSAGFSQGSHLVVLDGDDVEGFWTVTGAGPWFAERQPGVLDAPVIVVALADPAAYTRRYSENDKSGHGLETAPGWPVPFWSTDTAMVVQNLLLLAEDRGLGALMFGVFHGRDELLAWLGAPDHLEIVVAGAIGRRHRDDAVSGTASRRSRRPSSEVVHRGRWSGRSCVGRAPRWGRDLPASADHERGHTL